MGGTGASMANVRLASRDIDTSMMGDNTGRSLVVVVISGTGDCWWLGALIEPAAWRDESRLLALAVRIVATGTPFTYSRLPDEAICRRPFEAILQRAQDKKTKLKSGHT